jgi:hypothetical protein
MPLKLFTEHPASVNETYLGHCRNALGFGISMVVAGIACILHAFFPFAFIQTASNAIRRLNDRMVANRRTRPDSDQRASAQA